MIRRFFVTGVSLVLFVMLAIPAAGSSVVAAAARKGPGGITLSPALSEIVLTPGQTEASFDFTVRNNTNKPYEFALSIVDFGSLDESGGVLFVGRADKTIEYKYGLSNWATFQQDRIVVEPRGTAKIPVTITNRESLSPGGHYGAVLVTPTESGEDTKVQINQVASSLIFLKKQGGERYGLGLHSYSLKRRFAEVPGQADLRFQNTGNVHAVPRGVITLTDPLGRVVKKGYINAQSAMVLPESFRQMRVPLESLVSSFIPGTYRATISYRYDGEEVAQTKEFSFFYINGWYVLLGLLTLSLSIALLVSKRLRERAGRPFAIVRSLLPKYILKLHPRKP